MTKESLQAILDVLNQLSVPLKQENGATIAVSLFKAKSEVEEELKKCLSTTSDTPTAL